MMKQILEQMAVCQRQTEELSREVGRMRLAKEEVVATKAEGEQGHQTFMKRVKATTGYEERKCYGCGERGHLKNECPAKTSTATGSKPKVCYNCGLPGHFSSKCPEKNKTTAHEIAGVKSSHGINTEDDGKRTYMDIEFEIGNRLVLLDTGSEISLLPIEFQGSGSLQQSSQRVMAANGTEIKIIGSVRVTAKVMGVQIEIAGYVTPNVDEIIIGIDVLRQWECVWDFRTNRVHMFGMNILLNSRPKRNICRKIVLAEEVVIPPHSEMMAPGSMVFSDRVHIDPDENWATECHQICQGVYAASVVMPNRAVNVPTRIANITDRAIRLKEGTKIADLMPVEICCGDTSSHDEDRTSNKGHIIGQVANVSCVNNLSHDVHRTEEGQDIIKQMVGTAAESVSVENKRRLHELIEQHSAAFSFVEKELGCTDLIRHGIDTGNALPCRQPLRRQPPAHDKVIKEQIDLLLQQGAIEPAQSPWASNVVVVRKEDGKFRMCIDYRMLNDVTRKDSYSTVRVDTALDALSGAIWFSTLDLRSSYHQIEVEERDRDKTSWICKYGQYRYVRMPFGLSNSGATFQRLIDMVLSGISYIFCLAYIDDIIVFSETVEQHFDRLTCVLQRIIKAKLKCRPDKCVFLQTSVEFLGHLVSADGVAILPSRIEAVSTWPRPKSIREVREAYGLMSYYRRHIKNFAAIAQPVTDLLKGGRSAKFQWTDEAEESFERLKTALITSPVLAVPNDTDTFVLDTDASLFAIGAVLSQVRNGVEHVIAYASKRLKKAESNYCTSRRELLSAVHFVRHFRCYLLGKKFIIRTDNAALVWLRRLKKPVGQEARWMEELENYDYTIEHRAGRSHCNADAMSRRPPCDHTNHQRKCPMCDGESLHDDEEEQGKDIRAVYVMGRDHQSSDDDSQNRSIREKDIGDLSRRHEQQANRKPLGALSEQIEEERCYSIVVTSDDELRLQQMAEVDIGWIRDAVERGMDKPTWNEISAKSAESKALWAQWDRLCVRNGILMRKYESIPDGGDMFQVIMPKSIRKQFVKDLHEGLGCAHLGRNRTEALVRHRAYWPGWSDTVDLVIKCCAPCAKYSREKPPRQVGLTPIVCGEPFETVSIDITGPHPTSYSGHNFVLTVQDHFSRWTEAYPLRRHTAEAIAGQLFENWFSRYGFPLNLLSDLGPEMEGHIMKELCRLAHVDKIRTCAYSPKTNRKLERFHKTLNEMIAKCVDSNQKDWPSHLAFATAAYRATKHEATQFSPNRIVLGHEERIPVDLMYRLPEPHQEAKSVNEYVSANVDRMQRDYELVRKFMGRAAERMKERYNRKVKPGDKLSPGQKVWYYYPRRYTNKSQKWQSVYVGPFTVLKQIDDHRIVIRRHKHNVPLVVGRDKIKVIPHGMNFDDNAIENDTRNDKPTPGVARGDRGNVLHASDHRPTGIIMDHLDGKEGTSGTDRPRRTCNKPVYLDDYYVRRIICSFPTDKMEKKAMMGEKN